MNSIATHGKLEALARKEQTAKRIRAAMELIESEIENQDGLYRFNKGRLCQKELLKRARLSRTSLQKPTHLDLRIEVNHWVDRVNQRLIVGARSVRRAVTDRLDSLRGDFNHLLQRWAEAELEFIEAKR